MRWDGYDRKCWQADWIFAKIHDTVHTYVRTYLQLFSTSLIRQSSTCVMVCSCFASRDNLLILSVCSYKYVCAVCGHIQTCYQLSISNVCNGFAVYCVGFDLRTLYTLTHCM